MKHGFGGLRRGTLAILILLLTASCGGASTQDGAGSVGESPQEPSSDSSPMPAPETQDPATPTAVTAETGGEELGALGGECGQTATMIGTDVPIEIVMFGTKQYMCVVVPEGVTRVVFDLSEMTAALNLYVGYPDLSTLEAGGEQFWASEHGGRDDESIIIEPGDTGFVDPGSYFIEVSGGASADSASYVLTVSMS